MIKLRFTILISIFVIASGAKAEIYKWVDEEGNTYFSDESSEQYKMKSCRLNRDRAKKKCSRHSREQSKV
jgi:hypothetical protein